MLQFYLDMKNAQLIPSNTLIRGQREIEDPFGDIRLENSRGTRAACDRLVT